MNVTKNTILNLKVMIDDFERQIRKARNIDKTIADQLEDISVALFDLETFLEYYSTLSFWSIFEKATTRYEIRDIIQVINKRIAILTQSL